MTQVIEVTRFGGPEVLALRQVPEPEPGPGQVVIAVAVADVMFFDIGLRSGWLADFIPIRPPYVPGCGIAGEVVAAGDGVDATWIGQRVALSPGPQGGYAERAVVPADNLVVIPDGFSLEHAAALLNDGITAFRLAERAQLERGRRVLITGAAGGAATLLIQLCRAAGAHVIGAARGQRKLEVVEELGVDAIDYSEQGWQDRALELNEGNRFDVVFDGVGGEIGGAAFEITANGGWFSAHGMASGRFADIDKGEAASRDVTVTGTEQVDEMTAPDRKQLTERILAVAADHGVRPIIGQVFPLHQAADAHRAIQSRDAIAKTLLHCSQPS